MPFAPVNEAWCRSRREGKCVVSDETCSRVSSGVGYREWYTKSFPLVNREDRFLFVGASTSHFDFWQRKERKGTFLGAISEVDDDDSVRDLDQSLGRCSSRHNGLMLHRRRRRSISFSRTLSSIHPSLSAENPSIMGRM
eukprot:gb/GEZJ01000731.1/.p1 GENE.gb/GEZJ01000731.1/~~gb/GEZJ01000731.1/.p1  ORF type:complete len:139 (-),score=8.00 gb/GEZJ01000731.1/:485-901(-)